MFLLILRRNLSCNLQWRRHLVHPKRWYPHTILHGVTNHKTVWIATDLKPPNFMSVRLTVQWCCIFLSMPTLNVHRPKKNTRHQVDRASELCTVSPNICMSSVRNFHVILPEPTIWGWLYVSGKLVLSCSRYLLVEKRAVASVIKKLLAFHWTPMFITTFTKSWYRDPILGQQSP